MTDIADWALAFLMRVLAVPELSALLPAIGVGLAIAYLASLKFPEWLPIKTAQNYANVIIFFVVIIIATALLPTPRMALWSFTVAIFIPKTYEWLTEIIFHRWPWLKPKALLTAPEMQARVADKESP